MKMNRYMHKLLAISLLLMIITMTACEKKPEASTNEQGASEVIQNKSDSSIDNKNTDNNKNAITDDKASADNSPLASMKSSEIDAILYSLPENAIKYYNDINLPEGGKAIGWSYDMYEDNGIQKWKVNFKALYDGDCSNLTTFFKANMQDLVRSNSFDGPYEYDGSYKNIPYHIYLDEKIKDDGAKQTTLILGMKDSELAKKTITLNNVPFLQALGVPQAKNARLRTAYKLGDSYAYYCTTETRDTVFKYYKERLSKCSPKISNEKEFDMLIAQLDGYSMSININQVDEKNQTGFFKDENQAYQTSVEIRFITK